ncbi:hypothetical protein V1477_011677 [Vespula maculifrons]|uniref:Maturase K n=1 Tax=Vespula maculifrons TaxID=7453 RepID=A0ABD2C1J3_VESMC
MSWFSYRQNIQFYSQCISNLDVNSDDNGRLINPLYYYELLDIFSELDSSIFYFIQRIDSINIFLRENSLLLMKTMILPRRKSMLLKVFCEEKTG